MTTATATAPTDTGHDEPELPDMPPKAIETIDAPPRPEDDTKPKRPPRRSRRTPAESAPTAPRRRGRPPKAAAPTKVDLTPKLTELLTLGGTFLTLRDPIDGLVVLENAAKTADALNKLAQDNDTVYRALSMLTVTGAWGAVASVLFAQVVPILANHGVVLPVVGEASLNEYRTKAIAIGLIEAPAA